MCKCMHMHVRNHLLGHIRTWNSCCCSHFSVPKSKVENKRKEDDRESTFFSALFFHIRPLSFSFLPFHHIFFNTFPTRALPHTTLYPILVKALHIFLLVQRISPRPSLTPHLTNISFPPPSCSQNMAHQRQHQQPTNGGAGSKAPFLVLGAAALMIQSLLVLPTTANAETTINISTNNNNNDASVVANSGNSKVSFDLGMHHNLQTIASLSTEGSGPAGAGPQFWGATSAAAMVSRSNNATTPANLQQEQEQQQKDALEGSSLALYRKIRLEETSDAPAAVDSTAHTAATAKDVEVVEELEGIQSGEMEPAVDDDLGNEGKELLSQLV